MEESPMEMTNAVSGVRALNKKPLLVGGVLVFLVAFGLMYSVSQRGMKKHEEEDKKINVVESDPTAKIKSWEEQKKPISKIEASKPLISNKTGTGNDVHSDTSKNEQQNRQQNKQLSPEEQEKQRIRLMKIKLVADAMNAPTDVRVASNNQPINPIGGDGQNPPAPINPFALGMPTEPSTTEKNNDFLKNAKKDYRYVSIGKTDLISPYEIKTGTVIPGVLISGINSELPGEIIAQVSESVYDTATGNYLLIPQGTRIIGTYNSDVAYGQSRAFVGWTRLVFPDGKTISLGAMTGADQAGYSGFEDEVDNHYFKIFGSALLISLIGGELSFSNDKFSINQQQSSGGLGGSTISQTGNTLLEKNLAVAPTIEIRAGYRFNIMVSKDLVIEP